MDVGFILVIIGSLLLCVGVVGGFASVSPFGFKWSKTRQNIMLCCIVIGALLAIGGYLWLGMRN